MMASTSADSQPSVPAPVTGRPEARDDTTATEEFILEMLERLDSAEVRAVNLERALKHSRDIGAAIGILMARHKMTQEQAFAEMRRVSQDTNRKLYWLALDVVRTGELSHSQQ